jgi:hypothetical protein
MARAGEPPELGLREPAGPDPLPLATGERTAPVQMPLGTPVASATASWATGHPRLVCGHRHAQRNRSSTSTTIRPVHLLTGK